MAGIPSAPSSCHPRCYKASKIQSLLSEISQPRTETPGPRSYFTNIYFLLGTPPPSSHVNPGMTFVYTWEVPRDVGPTSADPNCLTWLYYSSVNLPKDINSGLVGPLLVCRSGSLGEDGKQVSHGPMSRYALVRGSLTQNRTAEEKQCGNLQFQFLLCADSLNPIIF